MVRYFRGYDRPAGVGQIASRAIRDRCSDMGADRCHPFDTGSNDARKLGYAGLARDNAGVADDRRESLYRHRHYLEPVGRTDCRDSRLSTEFRIPGSQVVSESEFR